MLFRLSMLSALGANELGFLFGPVPRPRSFHRVAFSLGLLSGPSRLFSNPISCPPALVYGGRAQRLYRFLNQMRFPRVCSGLVRLGLSRRHMSCDNDDFSVFAPISSSSFSFF